jgi:hypothetical protein
MPGPGAIFIGKMAEALPVTLLVFALAYADSKKRHGLTNSMRRVVVLFGYAFVISGLVYAIGYEAIATSFGMLQAPEMRGWFDIPAQFVLAAIASTFVIKSIGRAKTRLT